MKKIFGTLTCLLFIALCTFALADVAINQTNFPDAHFREALKDYDQNGDGILSDAEIADLTYLDVNNCEVASLSGIGYFPNLQSLNCSDNKLTVLDLSNNTKLTSLYCSDNKLTTLKLNCKSTLGWLECARNKLTSLNLGGYSSLSMLNCYGNSLTSLRITGCRALTDVWCAQNKLSSLDLSSVPSLNRLACYNNKLTRLNVSKCKKIDSFVKGVEPAVCHCRYGGVYYGWWDWGSFDFAVEDLPEFYLFVDRGLVATTSQGSTPSQATSATVNGGHYDLNDAKNAAIFSGPVNASAKTLVIQNTVKIGSKTYKVTEIGTDACYEMRNLTTLTIGKNVKKIGSEAFMYCSKLKKIKILSTVLKQIDSSAFYDTSSKATVYCPKKMMKKYRKLMLTAGLPESATFRPLK